MERTESTWWWPGGGEGDGLWKELISCALPVHWAVGLEKVAGVEAQSGDEKSKWQNGILAQEEGAIAIKPDKALTCFQMSISLPHSLFFPSTCNL